MMAIAGRPARPLRTHIAKVEKREVSPLLRSRAIERYGQMSMEFGRTSPFMKR